ncbi:MAG TPA: hypothetical protein PLP17_04400 [Oligoflexia bacterium]|nr:hypothetical protein [Oligoflexia bacterium]
MKRVVEQHRIRALVYLALGIALVCLTVCWLSLALYAVLSAHTLRTEALLAAVGLPITFIYSLNHVSGHLLWAADNWRKERELARRLPEITCFRLTPRQLRCVLFAATDVPLIWITLADAILNLPFIAAVFRTSLPSPAELTITLALYGMMLNLFYTYNSAVCHLSWIWDNWRKESREEQQRRNSVVQLRWWAWSDWSKRQKHSFVFFVVPDVLILIPATALNWAGALAVSKGLRHLSPAAELLPVMVLTAIYTYQNVYGHYCCLRQDVHNE